MPKTEKVAQKLPSTIGTGLGAGKGGGGRWLGEEHKFMKVRFFFFFVRALVHDAVVVPNFLSRFLGNPGREEVSETP